MSQTFKVGDRVRITKVFRGNVSPDAKARVGSVGTIVKAGGESDYVPYLVDLDGTPFGYRAENLAFAFSPGDRVVNTADGSSGVYVEDHDGNPDLVLCEWTNNEKGEARRRWSHRDHVEPDRSQFPAGTEVYARTRNQKSWFVGKVQPARLTPGELTIEVTKSGSSAPGGRFQIVREEDCIRVPQYPEPIVVPGQGERKITVTFPDHPWDDENREVTLDIEFVGGGGFKVQSFLKLKDAADGSGEFRVYAQHRFVPEALKNYPCGVKDHQGKACGKALRRVDEYLDWFSAIHNTIVADTMAGKLAGRPNQEILTHIYRTYSAMSVEGQMGARKVMAEVSELADLLATLGVKK